jgi:GH35 family endo-1,4-beta-xylanase
MFILVWGFITLNQILSQLKYKNYLMEQLTQHMHTLAQRYNDFLEEDSSK